MIFLKIVNKYHKFQMKINKIFMNKMKINKYNNINKY